MKQAMKDITYEQCENLARAMAERLKKTDNKVTPNLLT